MQAILAGEIALIGNTDGTFGGLLLDRPGYQAYVEDARVRAATRNAITPSEVAKVLGCDRGTVPGLMQLGLLHGTKSAVGLRITVESIEAFKGNYTSLASIAKEQGASSRALMQQCRDKEISLLLVSSTRKGGPQPFAAVSDRDAMEFRKCAEESCTRTQTRHENT